MTVIWSVMLCSIMISGALVACGPRNQSTKTTIIDTTLPEVSTEYLLNEFPMPVGTTWVYSYTPYTQHPEDPTQILTATYLMTETVIAIEEVLPYSFVSVQRDISLVSSKALTFTDLPPDKFWYVISGTKVFEQSMAPETTAFNLEYAHLAYEFPLEIGKQWCATQTDSENSGEFPCDVTIAVVEQIAYETPAGSFPDCYTVIEGYISGGVIYEFCNAIGPVTVRYDHSGTRFGFEKVLVDYVLP
ncbi:MAG: hypothetical protein JW981_06610 [Anaerolineae bacterium]|nr:hypothetical protein [Anaerolineae bacterium]